MCLVSLKKKWGSTSNGQIYYDREGLMNVMDLIGYWFFTLILYQLVIV